MKKALCFDLLEPLLSEKPPETPNENWRLLKQALLHVLRNELTECQRNVLLLYFFEKKSMPEIAGMLHINKSTVSRTIHRGIAHLERYLRYLPQR